MTTLMTSVKELSDLADRMAPEHMTDGGRTREWLERHGRTGKVLVNADWLDKYLDRCEAFHNMTSQEKVVHVIQDQLREAVTDIDDIYGNTMSENDNVSNWTMDVERIDDGYRCTEGYSAGGSFHAPVTIVTDKGLAYYENREVEENMLVEKAPSVYNITVNDIPGEDNMSYHTIIKEWLELFNVTEKEVCVRFADSIPYSDALDTVRNRIRSTFEGFVGDAPLSLEVASLMSKRLRESFYNANIRENNCVSYIQKYCGIEGGRMADVVCQRTCPDGVSNDRCYVVWNSMVFDLDRSREVLGWLMEEQPCA